MGSKDRPSFSKRQKEQARQAARKKKDERRELRKSERNDRPKDDLHEDPDIAGIVPGPQPMPSGDD